MVGLTVVYVSCDAHEGVYIDGTLSQHASGYNCIDTLALLEELANLEEPIVAVEMMELDEDWGASVERLPEELDDIERATQTCR